MLKLSGPGLDGKVVSVDAFRGFVMLLMMAEVLELWTMARQFSPTDPAREFWEAVTEPPIRIPNIPWFTDLPWNGNSQARYWTNRMSAFATMFHGVPDFFTPRPFPPLARHYQGISREEKDEKPC